MFVFPFVEHSRVLPREAAQSSNRHCIPYKGADLPAIPLHQAPCACSWCRNSQTRETREALLPLYIQHRMTAVNTTPGERTEIHQSLTHRDTWTLQDKQPHVSALFGGPWSEVPRFVLLRDPCPGSSSLVVLTLYTVLFI